MSSHPHRKWTVTEEQNRKSSREKSHERRQKPERPSKQRESSDRAISDEEKADSRKRKTHSENNGHSNSPVSAYSVHSSRRSGSRRRNSGVEDEDVQAKKIRTEEKQLHVTQESVDDKEKKEEIPDDSQESSLVKEMKKIRKRTFRDTKTEDSYVVLLDGEQCSLKGQGYFRVVHGTVNILGAVIAPSSKWRVLNSTVTSAMMSVTARGDSSLISDQVQIPSHMQTKLTVLQKSFGPSVAAIAFKKSTEDCSFTDYMGQCGVFSYMVELGEDEQVMPVFDSGVNLVLPSSRYPSIQFQQPVKERVDNMLTALPKHSMKVLICGGKNVGKSTLGRYCLNTILNKCAEVAFLECDVGQTEFTPSGCVSLTTLTQPVHGVPATHQQQPLKSVFFGSLSPIDDPARYILCVQHVWTYYVKHCANLPLVVNTMGWNKGLGLMLLADQVRMVKPDYIVQIDSNSTVHNLPVMSRENVTEMQGLIIDQEQEPEHELIAIQSALDANNRLPVNTRPAEHRALTLLGYFSLLKQPVWHATPYVVPFSDVAVHVTHCQVPNNHILYAMNATVVALCRVPSSCIAESSLANCPKFLSSTPANAHCLGLGFIRGIDPIRGQFYVVTPVDEDQLHNVNALIKGAVDICEEIFKKQRLDPPLYVDKMIPTTGSTQTKARRHMARNFKSPQ